jgi:hypothetical protein
MATRKIVNTMTKRKTENTMAKRTTDNAMAKRKTDNAMAKRRTDNTAIFKYFVLCILFSIISKRWFILFNSHYNCGYQNSHLLYSTVTRTKNIKIMSYSACSIKEAIVLLSLVLMTVE